MRRRVKLSAPSSLPSAMGERGTVNWVVPSGRTPRGSLEKSISEASPSSDQVKVRSWERGRRDLRGFKAVKVLEGYENIQLEGRESFRAFHFLTGVFQKKCVLTMATVAPIPAWPCRVCTRARTSGIMDCGTTRRLLPTLSRNRNRPSSRTSYPDTSTCSPGRAL